MSEKPVNKRAIEARNSIVNILTGFAGQGNTLVIPKPFIKWCDKDLAVALFFSQALYWSGATNEPNGWFALTVAEWEDDTSLTRAQMDRAAVILEQVGLEREVKRSQWHDYTPVVHYRFNREKLEEAARAFFNDGVVLKLESVKETKLKMKQARLDRKSDLRLSRKSGSKLSLKSEMSASLDSYKETTREKEKESLSAANAADGGGRDIGEKTFVTTASERLEDTSVSHTHTHTQEAEQQTRERSASKQRTATQNATTPIPQIAARPPSQNAATKEVKPESEKARIQRERMEAMITAGDFAPPVTNADFSNFRGVLKTLDEAGITPAMYPDYVKWVRDESKRTTNWTVSLRSLTNNMRPSTYMAEFRAGRRQISTQGGTQVVSTTTSPKNAYNPRLDPAYAYRYKDEEKKAQ